MTEVTVSTGTLSKGTEADVAQRLAKLSPAQRALLESRIAGRHPAPALGAVPKRDKPNRNRLSLDQERIWLIHQFDETSPVYNVFFGSRLRGPLDADAMERAVDAVVARHEPLRTTFEMDGDRAVQIAHETMTPGLRREDLSAIPADRREAEMFRLVNAEVSVPIDIKAGPPLRVVLYRLADDEHVMVTTVDHLVWDRQSAGIYESEVAGYYRAFVAGGEPELAELPIQYADYAEWQPQWLDQEVRKRQLPYWRDQLSGAPLVLELPTDFARPSVQTFNGARYEFSMTPRLTSAIRELARSEGVTVYVALLAAWQLLLHRYSGQEDIIVGTTSSTRNRPEIEAIIGYFLTMLPLRTTLRPDMTFRELLRATRATVVGAMDHHDMPFGMLLDELDIDRDPTRNPVYQASFFFVDFHESELDLAGLKLEPLVFDNRTAKDDCMLCIFDDVVLADHFFGLFEYNTDLFAESTVARMWDHLELLLEQGTADPGRRIGAFTLLAEDEAERMLGEWNRTEAPRETGVCLDDLVRRQAVRTPDAVAVRDADGSLTYAELVDQASRLAAHLAALGVGPETVVGVCLERSRDLLVGLLGVLMAGGAYLPLDPQFPARRVTEMTSDAGAGVLLTQGALVDRFADAAGEVVRLDLDRDAIMAREPLSGAPTVRADRLAYVIYTSGSTGRPKGVEVTHRNLVNLLTALAEDFRLVPGDVLTSVTSVSFDIAGLELYAPLISGASVVVVPRETAQDGRALGELIAASGATVMQATPATWHLLTESGWRNDTGMRLVVGGEALPKALAETLVADGAGPAWNVYGPTETTIWSTTWPIVDGAAEISIGRPLANTEVYVLDEHLDPVPVGLPGELYIGGRGVARGYRARPDLTADRFVPDPFSGRAGDRLYRTGDVVRYRPDGTIVFLGRNDGQVKLRGFRIELGEIEARLEQHPAVSRAVAIVREDRPGDRRLVAYVAGRGAAPAAERLREHLLATLPDYMIPSAFVEIAEFPLTTSGKIDRRALPKPSAERDGADYLAPRDEVELEVARIWEEVLDVRPVGLRDRFFDLGGHSLLVLKLVGRIEERFGQRLPMAAIFQGATVERFARMLRDGYEEQTDAHLVEIRPGRDGARPVYFAHPAGSEVVCYMPFGKLLEPEQRPLYAVSAPALRDGKLPYATFEDRAADYARVIREQQPQGPYSIVGWCYGGTNAFAIGRELENQGEQVEVVLIDAYPPVYVDPADEPGRAQIVEALALNLVWNFEEDRKSPGELAAMSDEEHLDYLLELARRGGYLPAESGRERIAEVVDLWVANLKLMWRYRPTPLAGPLTLIRASEPNPELAANPALFEAWHGWAGSGLRTAAAAGNHYTMMREPHDAGLAGTISTLLAGPIRFAEPDNGEGA
ncbi:MAG TPA: amino acid adenylation domain-containing protein [Actinocrinis sp.]|uniref:non-ribosomal peptide synthetase n=1 Tax=Actinocrinis sp. TaxID=1920516 RepID=UPI002DDDA508|nr:amino acid adenylation domain-containing protein [Actinocrinis sp.]HEV2348031.1 amino acid adenylation domain-containing protein [Actinocrinis sp.]